MRNPGHGWFTRTIAAPMALMWSVLTACGTPPTEQSVPPYEPPPAVRNATLIWSAEPGIDLFGPEAILIRATREADLVAAYAGPDSTYPGYMNAFVPGTVSRYPLTTGRGPLYGTERVRIQSVELRPNGFDASICVQTDGMVRGTEGRYLGSTGPAFLRTYSYARKPTTTTEHSAGTGDRDARTHPSPTESVAPETQSETPGWSAPTEDVFSGWNVDITGIADDTDGTCEAWGRTFFPDAPNAPLEVWSDNPPSTLPAYPGWPREMD